MAPNDIIFTFITVYYKHGAWDTHEFATMRDGLESFLDKYIPIDGMSNEELEDREKMRRLPNDDLLQILFDLGKPCNYSTNSGMSTAGNPQGLTDGKAKLVMAL
jgi:hypothetical protein